MNLQEAIKILKNTAPLRITVSGDIGAGKSTFAKHLAEDLGVPRVYAGQFAREEAKKLGLTLDEFGAQLERDDEFDKKVDEMQKYKAREIDRGIFEGRLAWYFVEEPDVKLFMQVDDEESAKRIWEDNKNDLRDKYGSIDELREASEDRKRSEETRYKNYYGVSAYDKNNFDVVVNTTGKEIDEVYKEAVIGLAKHIQANS